MTKPKPHLPGIADVDLNRLYSFAGIVDSEYRDFSQQRQHRKASRLQEAEAELQLVANPPALPAPPDESERIVDSGPPIAAQEPRFASAIVQHSELAKIDAKENALSPATAPAPTTAAKHWTVVRETGLGKEPRAAQVGQHSLSSVAFYSPVGGAGKSTLCANLGHALLALGEKVLLVDVSSHGVLPLHFGADPMRTGLRRFCPLGDVKTSILLMSDEEAGPAWIRDQVVPVTHHVSRSLFDLTGASDALLGEVLPLCRVMLVPLLPHPHVLLHAARANSRVKQWCRQFPSLQVFYVLNRFHVDQAADRELELQLRSQLGDELLDIKIPDSKSVSGAFEARTTVVDLQPVGAAALEFNAFGQWLRKIAPAREEMAVSRGWREV